MTHSNNLNFDQNISPHGTAYYSNVSADCAKPIIVFVHGVGLNKEVWAPQLSFLHNDFQLISYDLLGHGSSPLPPEGTRLQDYAEQLALLLDHLNVPQCIILGHSMGALISLYFSLHYADKVIAAVAMNMVYKRSQKQKHAVLARAQKVLDEKKIDDVDVALARWFSQHTTANDQIKIDQVSKWMNAANPIGVGRTYKLFASGDTTLSGKLAKLSMSVLYMTGENDANSTPEMSMTMADETPLGQAKILSGEEHMMAYISPEKTNKALLKFLEPYTVEVAK